MRLLLNLNQERGTTLIIVTHDPKVAARTQRTIRIGYEDGEGAPVQVSVAVNDLLNGKTDELTFEYAPWYRRLFRWLRNRLAL
jgi:ABC-type thiamine transport system ATPase subunit